MVAVYIGRRLLQGLVVMVLLLTVLFFTARLSGDPVTTLVGGQVTASDLAKLKTAYGLNKPLPEQYATFIWNASHLDFGRSVRSHQEALPTALQKAVVSLQLVLPALLLGLLLAVPLGTLAAMHRGGAIDAIASAGAVGGQSIPPFFLGLVLITVFGVKLAWFPVFGRGGLDHLVLPIVTLMAFPLARYTRLIRAQVTEAVTLDYVRTARAKGLKEGSIVLHHVFRNAMLPIVSLLGIELGVMISSAVIVEAVFAWPGFGTMAFDAATNRDYPMLQAAGFLVCATVLVSALVIDSLYVLIDPRMRTA